MTSNYTPGDYQPPADEALTTDSMTEINAAINGDGDPFAAEVDPETRRAAEQAERRASDIAGLRQLANWLEDHPGIEAPYAMGGAVFVELAEARDFMAEAPGGWDKRDSGDYWAYGRQFAGHVTYTAYVARENLCRKVQIGTKTVDAVPEHDEPIYRWECAPVDELDVDTLAASPAAKAEAEAPEPSVKMGGPR